MEPLELHSCHVRLLSLVEWEPGRRYNFDVDAIASSGFYCPHESDDPDRLRCLYCPAVVSNWKPGDDPWKEHLKATQRPCPHIKCSKGEEFIRMKLENILLEEDDESSYADYLLAGISDAVGANEQNANKEIQIAIRRRDMSSLQDRLESFDARSIGSNVLASKKTELALAGFYFEGCGPRNDSVRCFSCYGTMFNISEHDDIWREHATFLTDCSYVLTEKGEDFVSAVRGVGNICTDYRPGCAASFENNFGRPVDGHWKMSRKAEALPPSRQRSWRENENREGRKTVYLCCCVASSSDEGKGPCPQCGQNKQ